MVGDEITPITTHCHTARDGRWTCTSSFKGWDGAEYITRTADRRLNVAKDFAHNDVLRRIREAGVYRDTVEYEEGRGFTG